MFVLFHLKFAFLSTNKIAKAKESKCCQFKFFIKKKKHTITPVTSLCKTTIQMWCCVFIQCSLFALVVLVENQCPISFTGLPVVKESQTITLSCSTLPSCPSYPEIQGLPELTLLQEYTNVRKITNVTFEASWQDDEKEFRCQAQDNTDQHLVKKFTLTVECK